MIRNDSIYLFNWAKCALAVEVLYSANILGSGKLNKNNRTRSLSRSLFTKSITSQWYGFSAQMSLQFIRKWIRFLLSGSIVNNQPASLHEFLICNTWSPFVGHRRSQDYNGFSFVGGTPSPNIYYWSNRTCMCLNYNWGQDYNKILPTHYGVREFDQFVVSVAKDIININKQGGYFSQQPGHGNVLISA